MSTFLFVVDRKEADRPVMLGNFSFDQMPRTGEFLSINDEFFKVVSVIHVVTEISEASRASGEILVEPVNISEEPGLKFYWK